MLIVGTMGHISDGSKWPSKQLELLRQQVLDQRQAVAARQEKSEAALATLRVQCEVDLAVSAAKQEKQAVEHRDLVNKLTSNLRALQEQQEQLALSQRESATKARIAASVSDEMLAEASANIAALRHLLTHALQLAATMAGETQLTSETRAVADGGVGVSRGVLDGAALGQFESSAAKHAREGSEEEDLDLTEQRRDQARREEQLCIQLCGCTRRPPSSRTASEEAWTTSTSSWMWPSSTAPALTEAATRLSERCASPQPVTNLGPWCCTQSFLATAFWCNGLQQ